MPVTNQSDELIYRLARTIVAKLLPTADPGELETQTKDITRLITEQLQHGDFVRLERPGV